MPTGEDLLKQAAKSLSSKGLGDYYFYGANVPIFTPNYHGAWDCAEKATYDVYWVTKKIYGCVDNDAEDPEPYTGGWYSDMRRGHVIQIPVEEALVTPGAILLRYPRGST